MKTTQPSGINIGGIGYFKWKFPVSICRGLEGFWCYRDQWHQQVCGQQSHRVIQPSQTTLCPGLKLNS